jgi:polyisoprenoid-binding protein YceI
MNAERNPSVHRETGAETERWEIDPGRSSLAFSLRHIVMQQIRGRFERWGGTIFVNREAPWLSSAEIWVDLASITTDAPERDAHVRSAEFLDVARFPRARFRGTDVRLAQGLVIVGGTLDLHGIIHGIEVRAEIEKTTTAPDGRERARYTARGTVNRQAFGLRWNQDLDAGGFVVGDDVDLVAEIEVVRANGSRSSNAS